MTFQSEDRNKLFWLITTARAWDRDRDREWDWHNRRQWVRFVSMSQTSVNTSVYEQYLSTH